MPRSRFDELLTIAEEHDGLVTAEQARQSGFTDSVLARLTQRGRLERTARAFIASPTFRLAGSHTIWRQYCGRKPIVDLTKSPYRT